MGKFCFGQTEVEEISFQFNVADEAAREPYVEFQLAAAFDALASDDVAMGGRAIEVFGLVVSLFQCFYLSYVVGGEGDGAVAKQGAQPLPKRPYAKREIVFQQTDATAHAFHSLLFQFAYVGVQGTLHQSWVGVVEHGAVGDAVAGLVVKGVATYLSAPLQHGVVASRDDGWCSQLAQGVGHALGVFSEQLFHGAFLGDEAGHDVPFVGKDGSSARTAANDVDALAPAEVEVHLLVCHLIAAHHDRGAQLPREEVTVRGQLVGNILLGSQIESCPSSLGVGWQLHEAGRKVVLCFSHSYT